MSFPLQAKKARNGKLKIEWKTYKHIKSVLCLVLLWDMFRELKLKNRFHLLFLLPLFMEIYTLFHNIWIGFLLGFAHESIPIYTLHITFLNDWSMWSSHSHWKVIVTLTQSLINFFIWYFQYKWVFHFLSFLSFYSLQLYDLHKNITATEGRKWVWGKEIGKYFLSNFIILTLQGFCFMRCGRHCEEFVGW